MHRLALVLATLLAASACAGQRAVAVRDQLCAASRATCALIDSACTAGGAP